jgi:hypothetical protein
MVIQYPTVAPLSQASPLWSRQLHNWQSHKGPVNRCLVPPVLGHPRPPHTTRRCITKYVSREPVRIVERRGEWRVGSRMPIPRSSPPFSTHIDIFRSFPNILANRRWLACTLDASGNCSFYNLQYLLPSSIAWYLTGSAMAIVYLDSQIFYAPPIAASPEPASRDPRVLEGNPSVAIFGLPLYLPLS